jgi:hypothetical protein
MSDSLAKGKSKKAKGTTAKVACFSLFIFSLVLAQALRRFRAYYGIGAAMLRLPKGGRRCPMNGSTENRASEAFEKRGGHSHILTWAAANRMLPLVQRIVADVIACQHRLAVIQPEKDRLDRHRRELTWPERSRRYQLDEEIATGERTLQDGFSELNGLGVTLLDSETGRVGFPTEVNKRRAYFSWLPGEQTLSFWHYADDGERRPIPATWTKPEVRQKVKG